jgi:integrase
MRIKKPNRSFPIFPHPGGQWTKKVNGRSYYFGSWKNDPKGEAALEDWLARKDGILAGLDRLRVANAPEAITLGQLMKLFIENRRNAMLAGELAVPTYGDYVREIQTFVAAVGSDGQVSALTPAHFQEYANRMVRRKLGRHSRRRVTAYVKAMLNWGAKNGFFPKPTYGTGFVAPDTSPDAMRQAKVRAGEKDYSRRIVTGEELTKLLDAANPLFKGIILMAINCGLGPADLGRLRWRHIDPLSGELNMPRGKTGTERRGYIWKCTRKALRRVRKLKHNRVAIEQDGQEALIFVSRTGLPMYRERELVKDGVSVGTEICNSISGTFGRLARGLGMEGVTQYRLRHTFKTLGKRARDRDALNLCMGHRERSTGAIYDHEEIEFRRIKRVSMAVQRSLWPKPKPAATETTEMPNLRIAG